MMKRNVRLFAVLLIILLSFSSCVRQASPPPVDPEESSAPVTTAVPEQTAPPETETDPPETTESPPETEESETKEATEEATLPDDIVWTPVTEVYEEVIFGNETLPADTPSTEGPQQQTVYDPTYPSGGGTAPLGLMYHLILDEPYSALESLFVRPSELRGHIEALIDAGYTFIFADEYDYYDGKTVIMSFDDGYIDNYTEMFPIIKEYNVKVTVFMITNYINCPEYLTEDMIREMASSGLVSFQSHTASHANLASLGEDAMRYEFETSNRRLEELTGRKVRALCYPTGAYNYLTLSVASGYYDFAYTTVSTSSTAGYPLLELPRLRVSRGLGKDYFRSMIP